MITKEELKSRLLDTKCFIENEWLYKYIDLIDKNWNTQKQKFITQKHHIINRKFYTLNNLPIDNGENNVVNLIYSDHILAHFYLAKCSINDTIFASNILAVKFCCNAHHTKNITEEELLEILPNYNKMYELSLRIIGKINSTSWKGRTIWVNDGVRSFKIYKDKLDEYILNGYKKGRLNVIGHDQKGNNNGNYNTFKFTNGVTSIRCKLEDAPEGYYRTNPPRRQRTKIKCIETNKIYKSVAEANRITGINKYIIGKMCKGTLKENSYNMYNLHFTYYLEEEDDKC